MLEGAIDSAHSSSLHSTDMPPARVDGAKATETAWPRPSTDKAPRLQLAHTPFGFHYAAIRRPIVNSATHDYIRVSLFVAPFTVLIPPNNMYNLANLNVPRDDTHTTFYFIAWSDTGPGIDVESWRQAGGAPALSGTRALFHVEQPGQVEMRRQSTWRGDANRRGDAVPSGRGTPVHVERLR